MMSWVGPSSSRPRPSSKLGSASPYRREGWQRRCVPAIAWSYSLQTLCKTVALGHFTSSSTYCACAVTHYMMLASVLHHATASGDNILYFYVNTVVDKLISAWHWCMCHVYLATYQRTAGPTTKENPDSSRSIPRVTIKIIPHPFCTDVSVLQSCTVE